MFPVTLQFTINDAEQLAALGGALAQLTIKSEPKTGTKADAPKQEKPVEKATSPSTGTTSESSESSAPSGTGVSGETSRTFTLAEAKQMTTDAVKNGKRNEIVELLKEFGVPVAAKLEEHQVQGFCEKALALLNGGAK